MSVADIITAVVIWVLIGLGLGLIIWPPYRPKRGCGKRRKR